VGLERGPLSLVSTTEEQLDRKVAAVGIVRSQTQAMKFFFNAEVVGNSMAAFKEGSGTVPWGYAKLRGEQ
jgi:hypothetical protein